MVEAKETATGGFHWPEPAGHIGKSAIADRKSRDAEIAEYAESNKGQTVQQIGEYFDLSKSRVSQILRKQGVTKLAPNRRIFRCKQPGCSREFFGTRGYTSSKALYCPRHRRKR